jgi:hypothetical protein
MVVDIINKTLDTTAIVKNRNADITYRTILYPYFDGHFCERNWELAFGEKVDQLGTQIFYPRIEQKFKQFNNQQLQKENKTLAFNEPLKLLVEQLIHYTILLDSSFEE